MIAVVSIDTVVSEKGLEYIDKKVYSAPANYKSEDAIERYKKKAKAKELEKLSKHWTTGKVVCICAAILDSISGCHTATNCYTGDDEKAIIEGFFNMLVKEYISRCSGKGSQDFHVPFIIGRALVHKTGIPPILRNSNIDDVDKIFGYSKASSQRASLARYAHALGLSYNEKMPNAASVLPMIRLGIENWSTIEQSCRKNAEISLDILARYGIIFTNDNNVGGKYGSTVCENQAKG